jgi:hypothetical protein
MRLPARWWTSERALAAIATAAGLALSAGRLRLTGTTPSGSRFLANPRMLWTVLASRATIGSRKLGRIGTMSPQVALGEFWIPRRPLFAIGAAFMTPPAGVSASTVPSQTANTRLSPDNLASPRSPVETG